MWRALALNVGVLLRDVVLLRQWQALSRIAVLIALRQITAKWWVDTSANPTAGRRAWSAQVGA